MFEVIREAIARRLRISVDYAPGERLLEPHAVGYTADRKPALRAFQVSGASASGEHHEWKFLRIDRIRSLVVTNENFDSARPGYKRGDRHLKGGIVEQL